MPKLLVKICCVMSQSEAETAIKHGADMLGLVSDMPSGPGVLSLKKISQIVDKLPNDTKTILLTSKVRASEILRQHRQVKTSGVQLVDSVPENELLELRSLLPDTHLIQVIHVKDAASISEALRLSRLVDMLLLDSGSPLADKKTLGGTGIIHDWKISQEICKLCAIPVLLAGGLNSNNVAKGIVDVNPAGVDLCNGVRSNGNLDEAKLRAFMQNLPSANNVL